MTANPCKCPAGCPLCMDSAMVEERLNDSSACAREYFVTYGEFTATEEQVNFGLNDIDWRVRRAWALCTGFTPTAEQAARGLSDPDVDVREAWMCRQDFTITREQVESASTDLYKIRVRCLRRTD